MIPIFILHFRPMRVQHLSSLKIILTHQWDHYLTVAAWRNAHLYRLFFFFLKYFYAYGVLIIRPDEAKTFKIKDFLH